MSTTELIAKARGFASELEDATSGPPEQFEAADYIGQLADRLEECELALEAWESTQ